MKRVLVTGASGFLGGNLVKALVARGDTVRVLREEYQANPTLRDLKLETVEGCISHNEGLEEALDGVALVFHCATAQTMWRRMETALQQQCVAGTRNLCHALSRQQVTRLVFASPSETLCAGTRTSPADETTATQATRQKLPGAMLRVKAESIVMEYAATVSRQGGDVVIVNPTNMLGPGDHAPTFGKLLIERTRRSGVGCPVGGLNIVDVRDVCAGMIAAMELSSPRRRYILGGHNVSYKELLNMISNVLGKRGARVTWPGPVGAAAGALGELWGELTGRAPSTSQMLARYVGKQRYFDATRAREELKMPCTPLQQTIEDALEWFEAQGARKPG